MPREVNFDIVARDKASEHLDDVADKAGKVEQLDPTVTVDADTKPAISDVDAFADKLSGLTDADKVVVLALRAGNAQSELTSLATDLATLDASDPDIDIKLSRYAEVAADLDDLKAKMRDVADTSIDPDLEGKAVGRLREIGDEAGKTSDAVHSMAGNAIGDFAATATGIGPLGEAIGQVTEAALGGEAGLKGMVSAGLGMGAVSAGMILVNQAMEGFADAAKKAASFKAFNTADVEAFTKALTAGKDVAEDYANRMEALGKVTTIAGTASGFFTGEVSKSVQDIAPALAEAGITMDQFAKAVTGNQHDLDTFNDAVRAIGLSTETTNLIISGAQTEYDNVATASQNAAKFVKVFGDNTEASSKDVGKLGKALDDAEIKHHDQMIQDFTGSLGQFSGAVKTATSSYEGLSAQISGDQSMIDLANQIDRVEQAGKDAVVAQQEADAARGASAEDATGKQRAAEQATRDFQSAVNQTKQDIIRMAETAKVSPVELKATLDKVDSGDLAGAKADAEAWSRRNPVQISVKLADLGAALQRAAAGLNATVTAGPTVNVTQVLPRGWHGDALAQAQATARRTGGLYQRRRR